MTKKTADFLLIISVVLYILMALPMLNRYPPISVDEAWFSNPAYNLISYGHLGTSVMSGWHDIASRTYWMPPVDILIKALVFKLFGFKHIFIRLANVVIGLATLLLTYILGRTLLGKTSIVPSMAVLLLSAETLFLLNARWGRMEPAETFFAILALVALAKAIRIRRRWWFVLAGGAAAASALTHPLGVFAIVAVIVLLVVLTLEKYYSSAIRQFWQNIFLVGFGASIVSLPYIIYVAQAPSEALNQLRDNGAGSNLLANILKEPTRYIRWLFPVKNLAIPFLLFSVMVVLGASLVSIYFAIKGKDLAIRFLVIAFVSYLFILSLQSNKTYLYLSVGMPIELLIVCYMLDKFRQIVASRYQQPNWLGFWGLPTRHIISLVIILFVANNIVANLGSWWLYRKVNNSYVLGQIRKAVCPQDTIVGDATWWWAVPENAFIDVRAKRAALDNKDVRALFKVGNKTATLVIITRKIGGLGVEQVENLNQMLVRWTRIKQIIPFVADDKVEIREVKPIDKIKHPENE